MGYFRLLFGSGVAGSCGVHIQRLGLSDQIIQIGGAQGAGLLEHDLLLLDDHQRWNGLYLGRLSKIRILIDIDLGEIDVGVRFARLFESRSERAARAAPGGPEIYEY